MNKCPHCGSTDSFEYIATLVTLRIGEWGKDVDEEVRVEYSVFPKTVKCSGCGKRVKWDIAHGLAVEQMRAADFADCHVCGIAYPSTATVCTKCGGKLQSR